MTKEKFYTPKINIQETRKKYSQAADAYNLQFFDEDGNFVNKGSKKIDIKHKEVFVALCVIMDKRLKRKNNSIKKGTTPKPHNYIRNPYKFLVSTADILNMMTQNQSEKTEIARITIRRALERFERLATVNDENFILHKKFRREHSKYEIIINPDLVGFQELNTNFSNSSKSDLNNSKRTDSPNYTQYNTNIKNNKSNRTDFIEDKNLQANFNINNQKQKKEEQGESIRDNRTLAEKRKEYNETVENLTAKIKSSGEKKSSGEISKEIKQIIPSPRKTSRFHTDKEEKRAEQFEFFKKKLVRDFYIMLLGMLYSFKTAKLYLTENTETDYYLYTMQALDELAYNPAYFGKCVTIEDFEKRKILLENAIIRMKKHWMNKQESFNTERLFPNRFINGSFPNMKFEKAVDFHEKKLKQKHFRKKVSAKPKLSKSQYNGLLNRFYKDFDSKKIVVGDPFVRKYFGVYYSSIEDKIMARPRKEFTKQEIYKALQRCYNV